MRGHPARALARVVRANHGRRRCATCASRSSERCRRLQEPQRGTSGTRDLARSTTAIAAATRARRAQGDDSVVTFGVVAGQRWPAGVALPALASGDRLLLDPIPVDPVAQTSIDVRLVSATAGRELLAAVRTLSRVGLGRNRLRSWETIGGRLIRAHRSKRSGPGRRLVRGQRKPAIALSKSSTVASVGEVGVSARVAEADASSLPTTCSMVATRSALPASTARRALSSRPLP
jgi:hypothetical protein